MFVLLFVETLEGTMTGTRAKAGGDGSLVESLRMARVFEETWVQVFRYTFMLLRHREDAEDVAAEAFVRAQDAWMQGHGPDNEVLPWLLLIARRLVIDRQRRRRLIAWLPLASSHDRATGMSDLARAEVWIWFEQIAHSLSERQREVLVLRYQFDLTDEAIGQVMGLSPAGVRTLVYRAMSALRSRMGVSV